jgi:predicted metal-binding membrane protein
MLTNGRPTRDEGLSPAFVAMRARLALVILLFALAGVGWWWTARQMLGMDNGPWTNLGTLGWFLGIWVVMMAAMMFPSMAPTVALYSRMTRTRSLQLPIAFTSGYLAIWALAGAVAFTVVTGVGHISDNSLAWNRAGRPVAGVILIVAGIYQLTPLKDACLGKCRSPLGLLLGSWRDGRTGAFRMGARNGIWCVGCCWALMASLFALGIMSIAWMVFVVGLITVEKTIPWQRVASLGTALILLVLGILLLTDPSAIPLLTTPHSPMGNMPSMGS